METEETFEGPTSEEAFEEAKRGFVLFDGQEDEIQLKPYSPSRVLAAQNMGVRFPYIGEENWEALRSTGSYPGQMEEAFKLLWLCTLEDVARKQDEWTPDRASSKPTAARIAAIGWGKKLGLINLTELKSVQRYSEAAQVFMAIAQGVEASKFKVMRLESQEEAEKDDGPKV